MEYRARGHRFGANSGNKSGLPGGDALYATDEHTLKIEDDHAPTPSNRNARVHLTSASGSNDHCNGYQRQLARLPAAADVLHCCLRAPGEIMLHLCLHALT